MTFGRPPAIPESYIRTPLPKAMEKMAPEQTSATGLLSADFFVHTMYVWESSGEVVPFATQTGP